LQIHYAIAMQRGASMLTLHVGVRLMISEETERYTRIEGAFLRRSLSA
jgi:hypothetical protein